MARYFAISLRRGMSAESSARYEIWFASLYSPGYGYAFPCDAHGRVDIDRLSERARVNYFYARTVIGREFMFRLPARWGCPRAARPSGILDQVVVMHAFVRVVEAGTFDQSCSGPGGQHPDCQPAPFRVRRATCKWARFSGRSGRWH
jgi:hypothetical protein